MVGAGARLKPIGMKNFLAVLRTFFVRLALVLLGAGLIAASARIAVAFIGLFYHTSYRFVALFLLLILLSNLLAKLARVYIDA